MVLAFAPLQSYVTKKNVSLKLYVSGNNYDKEFYHCFLFTGHKIWCMTQHLSFTTWTNMSLVSTVAWNITELIPLICKFYYWFREHWHWEGVKVVISFPPLVKLWFQDIYLAFSCANVLEVIGAAVMVISMIVGEKIKIKLLVQSSFFCFVHFVKCIPYLFDSLKNETNEG